MPFKFDFGAKVRDKFTGAEGTVLGRTEWIHQCNRYTVQPFGTKDGKPFDCFGSDEHSLELLESPKTPHQPVTTGGPPSRGEPERGF